MCLRRSFVTRPALDVTFLPDSEAAVARLEALLDDVQPFAIEERAPGARRVHFLTPAARDTALEAIERQRRDFGVSASQVDIADDDWARRSQARRRAVRIGDIIVAPPWDVPEIESQAVGGGR